MLLRKTPIHLPLLTIYTLQVDIQVLMVESHLAGRIYSGTREELVDFMDSVGYKHISNAFKEEMRDVYKNFWTYRVNYPLWGGASGCCLRKGGELNLNQQESL